MGWHTSTEEVCEVDFVGHSWFCKHEYLKWMVDKPYGGEFKYVGEDMCLSFACQEHDVQTYVPPHPKAIPALWGSIPQYGWKYGTNAVAISLQGQNLAAMVAALDKMHRDGWTMLYERNPQYNEYLIQRHYPNALKSMTLTSKKLLQLFGKKRPIFIGERKYAAAVQDVFALTPEDYFILDDASGQFTIQRVLSAFRKYAIHIFFTGVYNQIKPHLEYQHLIENEDFINGMEILHIDDF